MRGENWDSAAELARVGGLTDRGRGNALGRNRATGLGSVELRGEREDREGKSEGSSGRGRQGNRARR